MAPKETLVSQHRGFFHMNNIRACVQAGVTHKSKIQSFPTFETAKHLSSISDRRVTKKPSPLQVSMVVGLQRHTIPTGPQPGRQREGQ